MITWTVELYKDGAKMLMEVQAQNQRQALEMAGWRAPGYRACSAQQAR